MSSFCCIIIVAFKATSVAAGTVDVDHLRRNTIRSVGKGWLRPVRRRGRRSTPRLGDDLFGRLSGGASVRGDALNGRRSYLDLELAKAA
ncbi:hypothetical protein [Mycobacterium helveticum]|uniref:Uncharacterized protein n=1 Tax=Mycobacterium helveticum TaxID=2592811 RepID=A0A557XPN7_9MYCO|nr:hypothetical protein [Mycobacterium helveticum]TVS84776.1 hypothetical protein FPZ46_16475 [Mycobacterium helveticum]TVS87859.1 hypothetical protein FPZ47_15120 [Mycobacterium helveticum]